MPFKEGAFKRIALWTSAPLVFAVVMYYASERPRQRLEERIRKVNIYYTLEELLLVITDLTILDFLLIQKGENK